MSVRMESSCRMVVFTLGYAFWKGCLHWTFVAAHYLIERLLDQGLGVRKLNIWLLCMELILDGNISFGLNELG